MTALLDEHLGLWAFLGSISMFGFIGNIMVTLVYSKKKDKQTSTFFILILALNDLYICSLLVPMTIYMETRLFETNNLALCKFHSFITTTAIPFSCLLMTAIAFDRFFCICMVYHKIMNLKRAKRIVLCLLVISGALGIIPALASVISISPEANSTNSTLDTNVYVCIIDVDSKYTIFGFLVMPFKQFYDLIYMASAVVIILLYLIIYKEIRQRKILKNKRIKLYALKHHDDPRLIEMLNIKPDINETSNSFKSKMGNFYFYN